MKKQKIAVIGSGISGLSAAWLLAKSHQVTLFEADHRLGGHAHTETFHDVPVDVGFIVFNEKTYPNLTALLRELNVATYETEMQFSVSLNDGRFEYSSKGIANLLGSPSNVISPSHWSMLSDLARFCRTAKTLSRDLSEDVSLEAFLKQHRFGKAFIDRHLIPMAAAIWSSHPDLMFSYPAKAFIDFFDNHQLLQMGTRDKWRTIKGGSRRYVTAIIESGIDLRKGDRVMSVERAPEEVTLRCASGFSEKFDQVVFATHADQALALLEQPSEDELSLLRQFHYSNNKVVVHRDASLMPINKRHWSSWNYVGTSQSENCGVTYWMNSLQNLETKTQYFVSLNPPKSPDAAQIEFQFDCTHPIFSAETLKAQKQLWRLQGKQKTWFCGAYFGAGFHEDGLQSGLAVAEQLGGMRRPWHVHNESGRIHLAPSPGAQAEVFVAAE